MNWYKESQGRYDNVPEENKGGSCFTDAFKYIFQEGVTNGNKDLELVHAIIQPVMGSLSGVEYGHAWVEKNGTVIDTSRENQEMDQQTYYMLAGLLNLPNVEDVRNGNAEMTIKEEKIKRYSVEDAQHFLDEHGYHGPWDDQISEYLPDKDEENDSDQY